MPRIAPSTNPKWTSLALNEVAHSQPYGGCVLCVVSVPVRRNLIRTGNDAKVSKTLTSGIVW